jgi:hypothetical protein
LKKIKFILISLILALGLPALADEYGLKATALYNFAKFVTWPAKAFAGADAPLVIGVLGADPFGKNLDGVVEGKTINGHPLKVKRFSAAADGLKSCHVLFICSSEKDKVGEVLGALKGSNVLTVSEIDNFPGKGGHLLLGMEGKKIALQINVGAAKKAGLEISSKLLQVCKIYEE